MRGLTNGPRIHPSRNRLTIFSSRRNLQAGRREEYRRLNTSCMARQKRHSSVEVATKLAQANNLATQGKSQGEIARTLGVSVMTLHRWRKAPPGPVGPQPVHEAGQPNRPLSGNGRIA